MLELKKGILNRARIEGSISEAWLITETTNFCAQYFDQSVETRINRLNRNEVRLNNDLAGELSIFHKKGVPLGGGNERRQLTNHEVKAAEMYVLQNCPEIYPYLRYYNLLIRND